MILDITDRLRRLGRDAVYEAADEIDRLRRDCAEAYQVIGALADAAGLFDSDSKNVCMVLDNLMAAAQGEPRPHNDPLPFILPEPEPEGRAR